MRITNRFNIFIVIWFASSMVFLNVGCNSTKNLKPNQVLLSSSIIKISAKRELKSKGELKDNLTRLEVQKPNSISLLFQSPLKLWYYNYRFKKFHNRPDSLLPKSAERPVIFDSASISKTSQNMKNFLFNSGYFYAKIKDTFFVKHNKATVIYSVSLGENYVIDKVSYDVEDTGIKKILIEHTGETALQKGKVYSISVVDAERSRIVSEIRNSGYYHFSQENILSFQLDTFDKSLFQNAESPFTGLINYVTKIKSNKSPTVDINIILKSTDDSLAFTKFIINTVNVYPDFRNFVDSVKRIKKSHDSIRYYFHNHFLNDKILDDHIFIRPGKVFSQKDYDNTLAKLHELGIFQYIRIVFTENSENKNMLDCNIFMNTSKKYDFSQNDEVSSGTTYDLGLSAGLNFHNKNFLKGANLLTLSLNGGIEYAYDANYGKSVAEHLKLLTEYLGLRASIDFPKFISPIGSSYFDNYNLPRTMLSGGVNFIDRLNYFELINTSASFTYNWRQNSDMSWSFSPIFVNVIQMPFETADFKTKLEQFPFLKNSYKPNFIEGENLSFTYSDMVRKHNKNYSYLRLGLEESGGILSGLNKIGGALNDLYKLNFAQYLKFDIDARHTFNFNFSSLNFRFLGGIGLPYGTSNTLPYIKQYFVGGPYSLRGWPIRSMGPGSYYDSSNIKNTLIDRTADVKLELNTELRFPIAPLFAGALKMNGAFFMDAGNIWLAKKDPSFPGGDFEINTLWQTTAADLGTGIRLEFATFLTFRLDVAIPVKKPYSLANDGWVLNQINFNNSSWRANNVLINAVIGYPF